jgi:hypothetical protein
MASKKLFAFWSDEIYYHFFALIPTVMDDEDAKALAEAATSDANREDDTNANPTDLSKLDKVGVCDDGLCVEESIKARLSPLGFEFLDPPVGLRQWEEHRQQETLLQARLRVEQIDFTVDSSGNLKIDTPTGEIYADVTQKTWSGQGTSGSLVHHDGVSQMITLIRLRHEATSLGLKVI